MGYTTYAAKSLIGSRRQVSISEHSFGLAQTKKYNILSRNPWSRPWRLPRDCVDGGRFSGKDCILDLICSYETVYAISLWERLGDQTVWNFEKEMECDGLVKNGRIGFGNQSGNWASPKIFVCNLIATLWENQASSIRFSNAIIRRHIRDFYLLRSII